MEGSFVFVCYRCFLCCWGCALEIRFVWLNWIYRGCLCLVFGDFGDEFASEEEATEGLGGSVGSVGVIIVDCNKPFSYGFIGF